MTDASATRDAFAQLLEVLEQAGERFCGQEWGVVTPHDVAESHRLVLHILQSALYAHAEFDPARPAFRRIVSPTRKFTGDNPDAVYFEAPLDPTRRYLIRGNLAGAVYTSFTVEAGADAGRYASHTDGVLRDDDIDVDAVGNYEIRLGGEPADRNWLELAPSAGRITTRHYFEWPTPAAADQGLHIPLTIEVVDPPPAPDRPDDASVAASIMAVVNHLRGKTIEQPTPARQGADPGALPEWVSREPNVFPQPQTPGNMAFSAFDAAYSMGRYELADDEALVMSGRWPTCRFANVALWNRFGQTYDYVNRPVGRNRTNTVLDADGRFTMVIAHRDPAHPNWLDTEGRPSGSVFWRFFLPEGPIETPTAQVVPFGELASALGSG